MLPADCGQLRHSNLDVALRERGVGFAPSFAAMSLRTLQGEKSCAQQTCKEVVCEVVQEDGSCAIYANVGHVTLPIHGVAAIGDIVAGARP